MCENTLYPARYDLKKGKGDDNEIFGTIHVYNDNYHLK